MRLPEFSAETSLYRSTKDYTETSTWKGISSEPLVTPQMYCEVWCDSWSGPCTRVCWGRPGPVQQ